MVSIVVSCLWLQGITAHVTNLSPEAQAARTS